MDLYFPSGLSFSAVDLPAPKRTTPDFFQEFALSKQAVSREEGAKRMGNHKWKWIAMGAYHGFSLEKIASHIFGSFLTADNCTKLVDDLIYKLFIPSIKYEEIRDTLKLPADLFDWFYNYLENRKLELFEKAVSPIKGGERWKKAKWKWVVIGADSHFSDEKIISHIFGSAIEASRYHRVLDAFTRRLVCAAGDHKRLKKIKKSSEISIKKLERLDEYLKKRAASRSLQIAPCEDFNNPLILQESVSEEVGLKRWKDRNLKWEWILKGLDAKLTYQQVYSRCFGEAITVDAFAELINKFIQRVDYAANNSGQLKKIQTSIRVSQKNFPRLLSHIKEQGLVDVSKLSSKQPQRPSENPDKRVQDQSLHISAPPFNPSIFQAPFLPNPRTPLALTQLLPSLAAIGQVPQTSLPDERLSRAPYRSENPDKRVQDQALHISAPLFSPSIFQAPFPPSPRTPLALTPLQQLLPSLAAIGQVPQTSLNERLSWSPLPFSPLTPLHPVSPAPFKTPAVPIKPRVRKASCAFTEQSKRQAIEERRDDCALPFSPLTPLEPPLPSFLEVEQVSQIPFRDENRGDRTLPLSPLPAVEPSVPSFAQETAPPPAYSAFQQVEKR